MSQQTNQRAVVTIAVNLDTTDVARGETRANTSFNQIERSAIQMGKRIQEALSFDWRSLLSHAKELNTILREIQSRGGASSKNSQFVDAKAEIENISRVRREREKQEKQYQDWWLRALHTRSEREAAALAKEQKGRERYEQWWEKALKAREAREERAASAATAARERQERSYSDWWNRELLKREAAERRAQERAAENARKTANAHLKQMAADSERAARNSAYSVRGVGAGGNKLQFASGTGDDPVRITNLTRSLRDAKKAQDDHNASMAQSVVIGNLLANVIERVASQIAHSLTQLVLYAARTEEIRISAQSMARANDISRASVDAQAESIQRLNITTQDSYSVMARFIQAQLDVTKANKLATVAQDLAVIAGVSTQEEIQRLTHAILTLQPEVLRSAGVFLTIEQIIGKVARATGRSIQSFSEQEKQMLTLNAVLEYGARVTGTYAAVLDNPAKQLRSLERVVAELSNTIGGPLQGALSASLKALIAVLEFFTKFPGVMALATAATTLFAFAVLAANTNLLMLAGNGLKAAIFSITRLAVAMVNMQALFAASTAVTLSVVAAYVAVAAAVAAIVYAIYRYGKAQDEVKAGDERRISLMMAQIKQGEENIKTLESNRAKIGQNVEANKLYLSALEQLSPIEQLRVRQLGMTTAGTDALIQKTKEATEASREQLRIELQRSALVTAKNLQEQAKAQEQNITALTRYNSILAEVRRREAAGQTSSNYIDQNDPQRRTQAEVLARLKKDLADIEALASKNGATIDKTRAQTEELTRSMAEAILQEEKLKDAKAADGAEGLKLIGVQIREKASRDLIIQQLDTMLPKMRQEAERYNGLAGAVNAYVDALERELSTKRTLNYRETPGAVRQNAEQLAKEIERTVEAVRQGTAGADGTNLRDRLRGELGREPSDTDAKRFAANLFRTELKQLEAAAKFAAASLNQNYKDYAKQVYGAQVVELMQLTGQIENAADKTKGFTDKLKEKKTEVEKLADRIKKLRTEIDKLARGGDSDQAEFERLDLIKSKIQRILDIRAELGRDVGQPVAGVEDAKSTGETMTLDAQYLIYERQKKKKEEIFNLTQRQAEAELSLSVLLSDALMGRVSAEGRAQETYLKNIIERKEAEADLTAQIAVEYQKRHESGVTLAQDAIRLESEAVLGALKEQNESRAGALKEIYGLAVAAFGDKAFQGNPLVRKAAELATKGVTPEIGQLQQANSYLASIDRSLAKLAGTTAADDTEEGRDRRRVMDALSNPNDAATMLEGLSASDRRSALSRLDEMVAQMNLYDRRDLNRPSAYDAQGNPTAYATRRFSELSREEQEAVGAEAARRRAIERDSRGFNAQLSTDKYNFVPRTDALYSNQQRSLTRATEVETVEQLDLAERRLTDTRVKGSLEQLHAIQQFQLGRKQAELTTAAELAALREQEDSGYLESARFRQSVEESAESGRLRARESSARRIIELEEEIKNAGHNAANEYREAWLEAYRAIQKRDEDAVKSQIRSSLELADQTTAHSEQVRAGVMEFFAQQRSVTQVSVDAITGTYDAAAGLIDRGIERITRRFGALGDVIKNVLSGLIRLTLNRVFMRLLDALVPGSGASQGGGAGAGLFSGGGAANGQQGFNPLNIIGQIFNPQRPGGTGVFNPTGGAMFAGNGTGATWMQNVAQEWVTGGVGSGAATPQTLTQQIGARDSIFGPQGILGALGVGGRGAGAAAGSPGLLASLSQSITPMLPVLGMTLGAGLGGNLGRGSRVGSLMGMIGGGALGGLGALLGAGMLSTAATGVGAFSSMGALSAFAPIISAALPIALVAAPLLIGAAILGHQARRRADERTRDKTIGEAFTSLQEILGQVESGRLDGVDGISQAMRVRSDYLENVGQLKDRKARDHATKDVYRLDLIIDQIKLSAQNQLENRKRDQIVPEFATGLENGRVPGHPGMPTHILAHGGEYVINSSQQAAIGALVLALAAKGENVSASGGSAISRIARQEESAERSGGGGSNGVINFNGDLVIEADVDAEGITAKGLKTRGGREEWDVNYNRRKQKGYSG